MTNKVKEDGLCPLTQQPCQCTMRSPGHWCGCSVPRTPMQAYRATMQLPPQFMLTCAVCKVDSPAVTNEDEVVDAAQDAGWQCNGINEDGLDLCVECRDREWRDGFSLGSDR